MTEPSNTESSFSPECPPLESLPDESLNSPEFFRSLGGAAIRHEDAVEIAAKHQRQRSDWLPEEQFHQSQSDYVDQEPSPFTYNAIMHTSSADELPSSNSFALPANEPFETAVDPRVPLAKPSSITTRRVWGTNFASFTMQQTLDYISDRIANRLPTHIITANLNFLMLCDQNAGIRQVAERADCIVCDGMPIVLRSRFNKSAQLPERVAGSDLIYRLSEQAAQKNHRIFFMGGAEGVAETTATRLQTQYPELQIAGVACPPFRKLTETETNELIEKIHASGADILLVAFGQPKGEQWIDQHLSELGGMVCIQLGASFDFVAGTAKRAPLIWQRLYLEWLYRACSDPKRLIPRYLQNAWFLLKTIRADILTWASPDNR